LDRGEKHVVRIKRYASKGAKFLTILEVCGFLVAHEAGEILHEEGKHEEELREGCQKKRNQTKGNEERRHRQGETREIIGVLEMPCVISLIRSISPAMCQV